MKKNIGILLLSLQLCAGIQAQLLDRHAVKSGIKTLCQDRRVIFAAGAVAAVAVYRGIDCLKNRWNAAQEQQAKDLIQQADYIGGGFVAPLVRTCANQELLAVKKQLQEAVLELHRLQSPGNGNRLSTISEGDEEKSSAENITTVEGLIDAFMGTMKRVEIVLGSDVTGLSQDFITNFLSELSPESGVSAFVRERSTDFSKNLLFIYAFSRALESMDPEKQLSVSAIGKARVATQRDALAPVPAEDQELVSQRLVKPVDMQGIPGSVPVLPASGQASPIIRDAAPAASPVPGQAEQAPVVAPRTDE